MLNWTAISTAGSGVQGGGSSVPAPDVLIFRAGQSLGDGTFSPNMYWSPDRQHILVDFGIQAPIDLSNWNGVRIWVKAPDGLGEGGYKYARVSDALLKVNFNEADDGTLYLYETLAFALDDLPDPIETWTFIACSLNQFNWENKDSGNVPSGPTVDLVTLDYSPYGLNFNAALTEGTTEGGEKGWIATFTWDAPSNPTYIKTRVLIMDEFGTGSVGQLTGEDPIVCDYPHVVGPYLYPESAVNVRFVLQSGFGDGTWADPDLCPHVHATLARAGATTGTEYAPVVTSLADGTCTWTNNADGSKTLHVPFTWTAPSDASYGGGVVKLIRAGGAHQEIGAGWASFTWNTGDYPASNESVTVYVLSTNKNNQRNTYVNGVTPAHVFTLPCPVLGSAGAEYTPQVTGYSVAVTYPTTADGTYRAVVGCTFTKPSDVTWAGVALRISSDGGTTWTEQKTVKASPATFEIPVPTAATAYKVGFFGVDVNGHVNTYQYGVTPTVDINVGDIAGKLDFRKFLGDSVASTFASIGGKFDVNSSGITEVKIAASAITETKIGPLAISTPKIQALAITTGLIAANAVVAEKIATNAIEAVKINAGAVSSAKLDATEISVGGGGGKPGKFGVYNAAGAQVGFIGVEDGVNSWFKNLGIAGPSKSAPKFFADGDELSIYGADIGITGTWYVGEQSLCLRASGENTESLTDGALTSGTKWSAANGFSLSSNQADYYHSASGGVLSQLRSDMAVPGRPGRWYAFTYTISGKSGTVSALITNAFAASSTALNLANGTHTIYFRSSAAPGSFIVSVSSSAGASFVIDSLSLQEWSDSPIEISNEVAALRADASSIILGAGDPSNPYPRVSIWRTFDAPGYNDSTILLQSDEELAKPYIVLSTIEDLPVYGARATLSIGRSGAYPRFSVQCSENSGSSVDLNLIPLTVNGTQVIGTDAVLTGKLRSWPGTTPTPVDKEIFSYWDGSAFWIACLENGNKWRAAMTNVANW